jgi:tetratricopeptide (TPR) repeat protein
MSGFDKSDHEPDWVRNTRVTAEAARAALASSKIPQERFEHFEQSTVAARQESKYATRRGEGDTNDARSSDETSYGNVERGDINLSGFEGQQTAHHASNNARSTIIEKCFSLADAALASNWTFPKTNEALFWYRSVLKVDPQNTKACLGSARAYQYIASQPWWCNDIRLVRNAAANALDMAEHIRVTSSAVEEREREIVKGQIYSATGLCDLADRHFDRALDFSEYSVIHYFKYFNQIFLRPKDDIILPGLDRAVKLAEAEGNQRRAAAALYFRGFANTLFENYDKAIVDLKKSMRINPGYGSANLALIAATALTRHKETYRAVRCFRERYPHFSRDILDYMWVDRSSCAEYRQLIRPMVEPVRAKLGN